MSIFAVRFHGQFGPMVENWYKIGHLGSSGILWGSSKPEKWFSLTKVKVQIKLPEYLKRRELQYYIMGSSSQMGSSSHILEPLTAAEKYLCNCKKMAFVFKWPKPGTRALTVRWSWNSTVWHCCTAAADVNLETMSLKESGKETKDTGRKTNRKKKSWICTDCVGCCWWWSPSVQTNEN